MSSNVVSFESYKEEKEFDSLLNRVEQILKGLGLPVNHSNQITTILLVMMYMKEEDCHIPTIEKLLAPRTYDEYMAHPTIKKAVEILVKEWNQ